MKQRGRILWLLWPILLVCGCGGGQGTTPTSLPSGGGGGSGGGSSDVITGNWEFSTTSMMGMPALAIAGAINQSGSSVSGQVHVSGSNCFDRLSTIALTGTATGSNVSLVLAAVSGQVITVNGTVDQHALTGSYSIKGGCASGDQGSVIGNNIPTLANNLNGTFTSSEGSTFDVTANLAQSGSPSVAGSYGITGTATFQAACFSSGTIHSGSFPSGSFILGTSVALVIATDNGTVNFSGNANSDRSEVNGNYTVSGATCNQSGTATLTLSSPWDY
jgi:hypothetical protein